MWLWYIILLLLLELTIFVRGNAKFVWGLELHPLEWWLYVGWFSSIVGLTAWWGIVDLIGVWKATILVLSLSCSVQFVLKWIFFYPPSLRNFLAIALCWIAVFVSENDPQKKTESEESSETKESKE